jgi:hypothetical protein
MGTRKVCHDSRSAWMFNLVILHDSRVLLVLASISSVSAPYYSVTIYTSMFCFCGFCIYFCFCKKYETKCGTTQFRFFYSVCMPIWKHMSVQSLLLFNGIGDRLLRNNIFLFTTTLESNFFPSDEVSSVPIIYHLLGMLLAKPNSTPGISTPENGIAKNSPMTNLWCH